MNSDPVPLEENVLQSSIIKKFPSKCVPSDAMRILNLKRLQIEKYIPLRKYFQCKVIKPIGRKVCVMARSENKPLTLLNGFKLFGMLIGFLFIRLIGFRVFSPLFF